MMDSVRDDTALTQMLAALTTLIEQHSPSMRCSILLLDADGLTLRHGAAPRLPREYCAAIDGLNIGPKAGSCGTAAFHRRTTVVSDIAHDELWTDYRGLALPHGLRACWSTPILATNGECLGTFAMYYDEPRTPSSMELDIITTAGALAAAVIEREGLLAASESARAELQQSNARLERQQAEVEAARVEADAANRAKSEFLATMSHELRTPLNAIGGYADLLLAGVRGELSTEQRADIERMKRSGQHLLGLINDILNFARLESGGVEFRIADTPVRSVLQSLEELMRPQIDTKTLAFEQNVPSDDVLVRADEEKVRQVLLNLVTNAVKFTDAGGLIAVECDADPSNVRIVVRDTGRGIPGEHLDRIFDPFIQIDRERIPKSQQGVGLGLSISRDLALGMGGSLTVTSTVGQGTAFTLTLPRGDCAALHRERSEESRTEEIFSPG
jgi:signal transduction histidine kinase